MTIRKTLGVGATGSLHGHVHRTDQEAGVTILIIEDESPIRSVITEILEDEGYPVVSATNGLEALRYLQQQDELPCLILLDLGMPVMSGWAFRAEQQRNPTLAAIPVIVMSALPHLNQKAAALKAVDCLSKPLDIDTLLGTVARYYQSEGERELEYGGSSVQ
jgi:CheY-like chemotaxis protein